MLLLANLNTQLEALKITFDEAILKGHSFKEVKRIYIEIKELDKLITERKHLLNLTGDKP